MTDVGVVRDARTTGSPVVRLRSSAVSGSDAAAAVEPSHSPEAARAVTVNADNEDRGFLDNVSPLYVCRDRRDAPQADGGFLSGLPADRGARHPLFTGRP